MTSENFESGSFRNVRILVLFIFIYSIILSLVALFLPTDGWPITTAPTFLSITMMAMMPFELFFLYALYRFLAPKTTAKSILGTAALLLVIAATPAIYGLLISVTDSYSRFLGVIMGLVFSLAGVFFAWNLLNRLWDSITQKIE